ncbi:translocon at the inner envelope membrane of chloroplasts 110 [Seminavis robusta]|uniref:Translocon at the inner envelope membrane of chloroplasts 110 n=1 Tax=Seminavis robusta TaxID=568900 RepID=A0A9N8H712_9STRA|nr:translocon at the inner envelope membrane of chloroplasts 110 [Seminavis robusta]|eukprot:Sro188_g081220.1 translocon at the inner envelope membrane of chloroplasts 110 (1133) ;mRNA; f:51398-55069
MRFHYAALALLLATSHQNAEAFSIRPAPSAFIPQYSMVPQKPRKTTMGATLTMFSETSGGYEELQELATNEEQSKAASLFRKSPSFWKIAGLATIPVSAALGFGLVPSRRIAAHAVGAVASGIAGAVGKSRLDAALVDSCSKPAIAEALLEAAEGGYLKNPKETATKVQQVQLEYGILDEDFDILCTDVYTQFILGMVKYQFQAKTSELKELEAIKVALSLDNLQVGEAHASAAQELYRTITQTTPEDELDDPENTDRMSIDKFLFLTERTLRQGGETQEAFVFEMTRVAKALKLDYATALDRVADAAEPFYHRALQSTREKLDTDQVSAGMLERARKTLGVSDATAKDLHVACLNEEVRALLGKTAASSDDEDDEKEDSAAAGDLSTVKFADGTMERLSKLSEILSLTESDVNYEITVEATPLYQATALDAMKDVLSLSKSPSDAWEIMEARRDELLLDEDATKSLISSMVMQALGGPLEATNKFAKVNNEAATYDNLIEALEAKEALISVLTKSGWNEFDNFDETFCNPWDKQSANGFLQSDERIKLYRIFLNRSVRNSEDGRLTDEMHEKVTEVKGLLGISDEQSEIEIRAVFGPLLQKALHKATTEIVEDYTPELVANMQKEVDEVMTNYRLSEKFLQEVGASFYAKAVALVHEKDPGGIPSKESVDALEALRSMVNLPAEDTYPSHMEFFGSTYRKSVLEAMGSTGVIREEFRPPLNDLRDRLGVSEENCKEIFLEAVKEKMVPMVEWIVSEFERTQLTQKQLSDRRKKDMGEDLFQTGKGATGTLGLGADVNLMSDIMNLVDFYEENDIAEKKEVGTKAVEGSDGESTEEVPVFETTFPVTGLGANALDQEVAELLYRQFVVGAFTSQGPQASRYEEARATFGGILGLTSEKMEEINGSIGDAVYDNFVANSMKTKGSLDQQDMMFLANIQGKLGLSSEQSEKMLLASQKKILSEEITVLMDEPTPEGIKAFREKCNGMGIDLVEDVGISKQRLGRMFEAEIIPGLKSGDITVDKADVLVEIQESFGIDEEECEAMFEGLLLRLSKSALDLIKGELMRGREEMTVDLIKELVRYAAFTDGELGLVVDEATGNQIFNVYEAFDFTGESEETVETNKGLLKEALGLSQ